MQIEVRCYICIDDDGRFLIGGDDAEVGVLPQCWHIVVGPGHHHLQIQ